MRIECSDKALKVRKGNFVMYDIDYLLDNLAREVCLLETYRQNKKTHPQVNWESVLSEVRKLSAEDFKDMKTVREVNTNEVHSENRSPE